MLRTPFEFQRPVAPGDQVDRERELAQLLELLDDGRLVRLAAPRRYGKTSLIGAAFARAEGDGVLTVRVDFAGILTAAEAADRIAAGYRGLRGPLARHVRDLVSAVDVAAGPVTVRSARGRESPQARLLRLLELPARLAHRRAAPVFVAFDEFQDVLTVPGLDGTLRSVIQQHDPDAVSYLFAGSEPRLLDRLFADRRRAFFGQAVPLDLGRLPPEPLAAYIAGRFEQSGRDAGEALEPLLAAAAGHPQRAMMLAHELWSATAAGAAADEGTFHRALVAARNLARPELLAEWRSFSANEQRVLRAVALSGGRPFRGEVVEAVGVRRGSIRYLLGELMARGTLERADAGYAFTDPFLEPVAAGAGGYDGPT